MEDGFHAKGFGDDEVGGVVVDEDAFFRGAVGHFEGFLEDEVAVFCGADGGGENEVIENVSEVHFFFKEVESFFVVVGDDAEFVAGFEFLAEVHHCGVLRGVFECGFQDFDVEFLADAFAKIVPDFGVSDLAKDEFFPFFAVTSGDLLKRDFRDEFLEVFACGERTGFVGGEDAVEVEKDGFDDGVFG